MSCEAVPDLDLLTIEEETELCKEVEEEVKMLDVEELLADDPEMQDIQDPPSLDTATKLSPAPLVTAMEVDNDFGQFVGELIDEMIHGDKSPVEPEPEMEVIEKSAVNGDKSPEFQENEGPNNDDKSSEAEPDEIEILDPGKIPWQLKFGKKLSTSTPSLPRTPEYRNTPTSFSDPSSDVEYLGNVSRESNISIPRTPGTPKNKLKVKETTKKVNKKVFGPSKGYKNRQQGKIEPSGDKICRRRTKNLQGREYGKVRDKFLPITDPLLEMVARSFAKAMERSALIAGKSPARDEPESARDTVEKAFARILEPPALDTSGVSAGDGSDSTKDKGKPETIANFPNFPGGLTKGLIELGAKLKGAPSSTKKAQMPAGSTQKLSEAQMPNNSAQMPRDPKVKAQMPYSRKVLSNTKVQIPVTNHDPSDPKEVHPKPPPPPLMKVRVPPPSGDPGFPSNPLKPRFEVIRKSKRVVTEERITVLLGGPLVKKWGHKN